MYVYVCVHAMYTRMYAYNIDIIYTFGMPGLQEYLRVFLLDSESFTTNILVSLTAKLLPIETYPLYSILLVEQKNLNLKIGVGIDLHNKN